MGYQISTDKTVTWREFSALMAAVGWGEHDEALFLRSCRAYPLVAHARMDDGAVVGYVSAFSDGAFSTMLGELVVHPAVQGRGIGRALMQRIELEFPGVPIYVKAMGGARHFFSACGYREPQAQVTVMFKRPPPPGHDREGGL
ncbi:hypothetical protein GmRootA79_28140 [Acidovorax sp. A79]|uniref:GNAT family N-acetyltransferase n=1 Tax=unclassified Acidovorax TaxID=2684926 RepID=UPI001C47DF04|nr:MULTISPECIES: GNAT family N-acetyltransferase [unclassified Acidovorax]MBV7429712.1 GNAT family N-acetyltransferase [Acidovorax sp. sif0732]MBV7448790.1 GNAT family N-acetyltransferase [Acidovorax sp. sif0715]